MKSTRSVRYIVLVAAAFAVLGACKSSDVSKTACDKAVDNRLELNAFELFDASGVCAAENRLTDANILLFTGQNRAMTDMTIFKPNEDADGKVMADLYALIYATYGGTGYDQPYTEEASTETMFDTLKAEPVRYSEDYNPGWAYSSESRTDLYDGVASDQLANRMWNMEHHALLLKIPEYLEARQASNEISSGKGAIQADSPEMAEIVRLVKIMQEASKHVEQGPPPEPTVPAYAFYSAPDSGDFQQVASGLNGPKNTAYDIFKSAQDARDSWVSNALGKEALEDILTAIDFESQALGAYAIGSRRNASGNIYVTDFDYDEEWKSYFINVAVGILPDDCQSDGATSHPFALAVTNGGPATSTMSSGTNNFPDKCPE